MKILIDALARCSGGYLGHLKGILSYGCIPPDISVFVVCSEEVAKNIGPVNLQVNFIIDENIVPSPLKQHRWRAEKLTSYFEEYDIDVHYNPRGLLSKKREPCIPKVTMCRNLLPFDKNEVKRYPPLSIERIRQYLRYYTEISSFRRADGLIFLSEYSREVLLSGGMDAKNIKVISHGVDECFRRKPSHKVSGEFPKILYVSPKYIYKHQWKVAEAIDILRKETSHDIQLDLVGPSAPYGSHKLSSTIRKLGNPSWLKNIGNVPHEHLPDILHSADIFVWASTVETFGLGLVEAMASGLPIACSYRRPMSDILEEAGVYFDPEHPPSISRAIKRLLEDDELRNANAAKAYSKALEYSWQKCAKETFSFLKEVGDNRDVLRIK